MEQRGYGRRIIVAIGGNAIAPFGRDEEGQRWAVRQAMEQVAQLLQDGNEVVLTHGNGPQVGHLVAQNEVALPGVPKMTLDVCVAQTQASIGLMLMTALEEVLTEKKIDREPTSILTRVSVSPHDPAWETPTKPIGSVSNDQPSAMDGAAPQTKAPSRQARRLVSSPEPLEIVDIRPIDSLLEAGFVPIVAGGGGIPGVREGSSWRGVEAVLDKDLTAALLGRRLQADSLVIATDVENVVVDFGRPEARPLHRVTVGELRSLASSGHFPAGSMGPKVEAAARFVEKSSGRAVITSMGSIYAAANGAAGTIVEPEDRAA